MLFYDQEIIPKEFIPEWDRWNREPKASSSELVQLTFGFEPGIIWNTDKKIKAKLNTHFNELRESNSNFNLTVQGFRDEVFKTHALVKSHIKNGILINKAKYKFNNNIYEIFICDYIDYLKELKIPYPDQFNSNINSALIPEKDNINHGFIKDEELTKGQKSGLTQRNNTLKRLSNQLYKILEKDYLSMSMQF